MPDIYSLPLQGDLSSTFSIKQKQRAFLDGCHRWSWCQPVGGQSFQEGRNTVGDLLGLWPGLGPPAVLLLKMTHGERSDAVLQKQHVCHHISEQTTQSHRHWVWESRGGRPRTQVRSEEGSRALQPGSFCAKESSNSPKERETKSQLTLSRTWVWS